MNTSAMRRVFRRAAPIHFVLLLLCAAPGPVAQQPPAESGLLEEAQVRVFVVRLRIEAKEPADAAACRALGLDGLEVVLRGEPVEARGLLKLERASDPLREKEPMLHVLLLDTSRSIEDWLDYVRDAAASYVEMLDPARDRGMLATFDDSVVLVEAPTSDRDALLEAARNVRMGSVTSLVDGLYYTLRELEAWPERPVVILLTDGVDTTSYHDRNEVNRLADGRPDLITFTIGLDMPFFSRGLIPGVASSKRFMQRLAARTNGQWLDHPTGFRLQKAFEKVRDMLEAEAVLTFVDPHPDAEPGKVKVSSTNRACKVVTYDEAATVDPDARHRPIGTPWPEPPFSLPLEPDPKYRIAYVPSRDVEIDPACSQRDAKGIPSWDMRVEPGRIEACALDITIEDGPLYDYYSSFRARFNRWPEQNTRHLEMEIPTFADLPGAPEELMDPLADFALAVAERPVRTGEWQVPIEAHARPYHDWPGLCNGKLFFHLRSRLARGLFAQPEYRNWVLSRLDEEARAGIGGLKERLRAYAPALDDAALEEIARATEEGRRILARAEVPSEVDLQGYLSAWLGDVPAAELFRRWERGRIDRLLKADQPIPFQPFLDRWTALRKMFFVPSYARVLTLLTPMHDLERDRIGYWRVILPRPSWFGQRIKGWKNRVDYSDLPMDLIPDVPLALHVFDGLCERNPGLRAHLRNAGYRVESIDYELLGRPWKQSPERGFREVRVLLELAAAPPGGGGERAVLRISAEFDRDRLDEPAEPVSLNLEARGDDRLEELTRSAQVSRE